MKKLFLSMAIVCLVSLVAGARNETPGLGLPTLHIIKEATLSPAYSCRSADEFGKGYQGTALFLSAYSKQLNSPDLLFNGACGADDWFDVTFGGDDMSLIADLGEKVSLEDVSVSRAFNLERVHRATAYSKFTKTVKVQLNHTYAVVLNESDKRGLFVFTVTGYVPNKEVELKYTVKSYQVTTSGQQSSPDFDWERKSN